MRCRLGSRDVAVRVLTAGPYSARPAGSSMLCAAPQAAELAQALRNLPDATRAYKGIAAFQGHAYAFLDRAAAGC